MSSSPVEVHVTTSTRWRTLLASFAVFALSAVLVAAGPPSPGAPGLGVLAGPAATTASTASHVAAAFDTGLDDLASLPRLSPVRHTDPGQQVARWLPAGSALLLAVGLLLLGLAAPACRPAGRPGQSRRPRGPPHHVRARALLRA